MPKKLTVIGVLAALALGAFGLFNSSGQAAQIQEFDEADINWTACYGGAAPTGGVLGCGLGSSATNVPVNVDINSWTIIDLPAGQRLTLPITFTPTTWSSATVPCSSVGGPNNDCTASEITGNVTARSELLCDGVSDILSSNTLPGSDPWPSSDTEANGGWEPFNFVRVAADAALGGTGAPGGTSPNAYVPDIVPFSSSMTFRSLDRADLDQLFLGGVTPLSITPVPLQLASYRNNAFGYDASVALLGGAPGNPPTNEYLCLDSPQDSIALTDFLNTPDTDGLFPRWTIFTGDIDERDSTVIDRIVDLGCVIVGTGAPDADGDCLSDAADADDGNPDQDGDGLPDGLEAAISFPVNAVDADGDGANDYTELFQFTDPNNADTDGDGSNDRPDNGADENIGTLAVDDTTADDNCPNVPNADQLNTDSAPDFKIVPPVGNLDVTNNRQDTQGDACDNDIDNDGIVNVAEGNVTIAGAAPYCVGDGSGSAPQGGSLSALDPDHDDDLGLDGRECQQMTRPDCGGGSTSGCTAAQGRMGVGGTNDAPDNDQLFAPGTPGDQNATAETFYRTQNIGVANGNADDLADGTNDGQADNPDLDASTPGTTDNDSDNDGLQDGIEVRYYATHPANPDTDADGCSDGKEAADVNGDRAVTSADIASIANTSLPVFGNYRNSNSGAVDNNRKNYDLNRDGNINAADLGTAANSFNFGGCASNRQLGPGLNNQTRNP